MTLELTQTWVELNSESTFQDCGSEQLKIENQNLNLIHIMYLSMQFSGFLLVKN